MYALQLTPYGLTDLFEESITDHPSVESVFRSNPVSDYQGHDVDVMSSASHVQLTIDLPGVKMQDLNVMVEEDGTFTVSGCRKYNSIEEDGKVLKKARFSRRFQFDSETTDMSQAEANLADGVLTLRAPKKTKPQPRKLIVLKPTESRDNKKATEGKPQETDASKEADSNDDAAKILEPTSNDSPETKK